VKPMTEPAAEAAIRVACRELHLPTIAAEATRIADDAAHQRLTHRAFLAEVLAAEVDERANRRRARRLHEARFPRMKRLEDSWLHRGARRSPDHRRCAAGRRVPSTPATRSCCWVTPAPATPTC
jgi:hypothetical protein